MCIFSLGLVLLRSRNQDPNFQREEARPEMESDLRAKPETVPQTLSSPKAETIFINVKLKPAQSPHPCSRPAEVQAWWTALDTCTEVTGSHSETRPEQSLLTFLSKAKGSILLPGWATPAVITTQFCCQKHIN